MPARAGNWPLLGHSSDPVPGDPDQLHDLITYYTKIADTIKSEATTLQRIGAGDTTEQKGQSADAIRSRSKDVAASLTKTSGRYDAVARALAVYGPALEMARTESAKALQEAEAADGARGSSAGMPDPAANRPSDAPTLTDEENAQIHARTSAMADAAEAGGQAQRRMDAAIAALDAAGKSASTLIRGAWDDGLVDTWQYKLREGFLKFLKILVKVLMWIGVALAVLAFFIPGLGAAALAGAIVAVASVVGTFALAGMGEGSWLDAIIAVVGVVLIGVGAIVAKVVQTAHVAAIARASSGAARSGTGTLATKIAAKTAAAAAKRQAVFADALESRISVSAAMKRIGAIDRRLLTITRDMQAGMATQVATKNAIKPQFWNVATKGYRPNDLAKLRDFGSKYRFDRLFAFDRVGDYKKLQATLQVEFGLVPKAIPWWYYANTGRVVGNFGISTMKWSTTPTGFGTDTSRSSTSPEYAAAKAALTSPTR
jgi:hypothetical protein